MDTATIQADGYSRVTLVATLDNRAPMSRRQLLLTTTDGRFVGVKTADGSDGRRADVTVDADGRAVVDLQSAGTVASARVRAEVAAAPTVNATMVVRFAEVGPGAVVRFDSSALAAVADGFSVTPVALRIDAGVPTDQRTVRLETTSGTFTTGKLAEGGTVTEVPVDGSNAVTVGLRSPTQPATGTVRATLAKVTRELRVDFRPVVVNELLRFTTPSPTVEADGASVATLAVWISPRLRDVARTVRFETSAGTFVANTSADGGANAQVTLDQTDTARVFLRSPTFSTPARVRVTAGAFSQEMLLTFVPAFPDQILVDPGRFVMKPTEETTVTARMVRRVGVVSRNTLVEFRAFGPDGSEVGRFRDVRPSNNEGLATATYAPLGIATEIVVRVVARTSDGREGAARLDVKP